MGFSFSNVPLLSSYSHRDLVTKIDWTNCQVVRRQIAQKREEIKKHLTIHMRRLGTDYYSTLPGEGEMAVQTIFDLAETVLHDADDLMIIPANAKGKRDKGSIIMYVHNIFVYDAARPGDVPNWTLAHDIARDFIPHFYNKSNPSPKLVQGQAPEDAENTTLKDKIRIGLAKLKK